MIAEVNPAMPNTVGDTHLHLDQIDRLVLVDCPVIEYQHPAVPGPVIEQIARYISGIIDDGSTLQIGLGRITHEALKLPGSIGQRPRHPFGRHHRRDHPAARQR